MQEERESSTGLGYLLTLPAEYSTARRWPMLLHLHGASSRGDDFTAFQCRHSSARVDGAADFILVRPQCPAGQQWVTVKLRAQVMALLDELVNSLPVDAAQIVLSGASMGGDAVWTLGASHPSRWAALVPICASRNLDAVPALSRTPIWIWHGTHDVVYPVSGSETMYSMLINGSSNLTSRVRFTRLDDCPTPEHAPHSVCHAAWLPALAEASALWPWLREQLAAASPAALSPPSSPHAFCRSRDVYTSARYLSLLQHRPSLGSSIALPGEGAARPATRPRLKPDAKLRLFAFYGMGGFSLSLSSWWQNAPAWLEVRPIELPGHGWREAEPLPLSPGSVSDPLKFLKPEDQPHLSFIDSPFTTKREHEAYVRLPSLDEREAAIASAIQRVSIAKQAGAAASAAASAASAPAAPPAAPPGVSVAFVKATAISITVEFRVPTEWPPVGGYELQWRPELGPEGDQSQWKTASSNLAGPTATKGLLKAGAAYVFRARSRTRLNDGSLDEWSNYGEASAPMATVGSGSPTPADSPTSAAGNGDASNAAAPPPNICAAALARAFAAARDSVVNAICDAMAPLLHQPYAICELAWIQHVRPRLRYPLILFATHLCRSPSCLPFATPDGFSNGAMMGFLVAIELQRRGLPPPLRVFCSCRGAPHICSRPLEELKALYLMDDASTIAWAERAGELGGIEACPSCISLYACYF